MIELEAGGTTAFQDRTHLSLLDAVNVNVGGEGRSTAVTDIDDEWALSPIKFLDVSSKTYVVPTVTVLRVYEVTEWSTVAEEAVGDVLYIT